MERKDIRYGEENGIIKQEVKHFLISDVQKDPRWREKNGRYEFILSIANSLDDLTVFDKDLSDGAYDPNSNYWDTSTYNLRKGVKLSSKKAYEKYIDPVINPDFSKEA